MARRTLGVSIHPGVEAFVGTIRVLDDALINRIAAGEVVERPASVVKELVENALDAGASSVAVSLETGGKHRIRVGDDGCGMDRDDALLALERHATSKLSRASDLGAITTLGFRGEALPSIAAVSRFLLRTATSEGAGTEIEVQGGKIVAVREMGLPRGTSVEVGSLFFNVPARRKFLRSDATELSHAVRLVGRQALAHPAVRFTLDHGGRKLLDLPGATCLEDRAARILGRETAARLVPFRLERDGAVVRGLAGRPVDAASRRDVQYLFVNGRAVQDRTLSHGLTAAYGNTVPRDRFPAVILFFEIDPALVDVNVHPQKLEVRFARGGEAHDLVRDGVAAALGGDRAVPRLAELRPGQPSGGGVGEAVLSYLATHEEAPAASWSAPRGWSGALASAGEPVPGHDGPAAREPRVAETAGLVEVGGAVPLAQLRDSYVIAEDREGLVIVDQHAAHERILFERYLDEAERNQVETQPLLFPVTAEFPAHERLLLEEETEEFRRLGFRVEPFGGDAVRIDAVPAVLSGLDPVAILRNLVGEAARAPSTSTAVEPLRRRLVTTAAGHAAINGHHPLSPPEMQHLLDALMRTSNPTTCPHGRPVLFRLSMEEIERAFRRR